MNWLRRFMQGRYGTDELSFAFIILFIIFNVISLITPSFVVSIIYIILFAFFLFRMLSRNIAARQRENYCFLKLWNPVQNYFRKLSVRIKNRKKYKYFKCTSCSRSMRVPRGKGNVIVTCPNCGTKMKKKT